MGWFVDGIRLDQFAFNVRNRSAAWRVPSKRGENVIVPGRHGAIWNPRKKFDQGSLVMSMYANGAEEDGTMPTDSTSQQQVRENLDKLTGLFGQTGRQLEVVRSDDATAPITNLIRNPSFEGPTTELVQRKNLIVDPLLAAPTNQTIEELVTYNHMRNPSANNGTFVTGGYAGAGTSTVSASTSQAMEVGGKSFSGFNGSATTTMGVRQLVYLPAGKWNVSVWVFVPVTVTETISLMRFGASPHAAAVPTVSYTMTGTVTKGSWSRVSAAIDVTDDYEDVYFYIVMTANMAVGRTIYWDQLQITPGPRLWTYFDGASPDDVTYTHSWEGSANQTRSRKTGRLPSTWFRQVSSGSPVFNQDFDTRMIRDPSLAPAGATYSGLVFATGERLLTDLGNAYTYATVPVTGSQVVSGSVQVRWVSGTPRAMALQFAVRNISGSIIQTLTSSTTTPTTGAWSTITFNNQTLSAGAKTLEFRIEAGSGGDVVSAAGGDTWRFGLALLVSGATAGTFFSGNSADTSRLVYSWQGAAHNSPSLEAWLVPENWVQTVASVGIFKDSAYSPDGEFSMVMTAVSGQACEVKSTQEPAPPSGRGSILGTVKALNACRAHMILYQYDAAGVQQQGNSTTADLILNATASLSLANVVLRSDTRFVELRFRVTQTGTSTAPNWTGDSLAVDQALMVVDEATIPALTWFDGDTAGAFWAGEPDNSYSILGGTARRCFAELIQSIDMESMAGGTRAEFSVELTVPAGCWDEVTPRTMTFNITRLDQVFDLTQWAGSTFPLEDFVFEIAGTVVTPRLTDYISGAWVRWENNVESGETLAIDVGESTVTLNGVNAISNVTHAGALLFLPLTPEGGLRFAPRLRLQCHTFSGSPTLTVTGRRRYLIA